MKKKKIFLGAGALIAFSVTLITIQKLLLEDFPSKANLATVYFLYATSLLAALHAATFWLRLELLENRERGLSKNTPRYIDYGITTIIAAGLFQVYFSDESIAKYITKISGPRQEILNSIKTAAQKHLDSDCKPDSGILVVACEALGKERCGQKKNFTAEFCKKTAEINNQANLEKYIIENLSKDTEYLNHPVEFVAEQGGGAQAIYSPIRKYANQIVASAEYSVASADIESKFALNWVSLILLPIVIALRALKTSIEIFGEL